MTSLSFLRLPPRVPSVSIPRSEFVLAILRKVGMRSWGTMTVLIEELLLNCSFAVRSKVGTGLDEGGGEPTGAGFTQRSYEGSGSELGRAEGDAREAEGKAEGAEGS